LADLVPQHSRQTADPNAGMQDATIITPARKTDTVA
jgi:hypothetical protein